MKPFPFSFRTALLAVVCWLGLSTADAVPWVERHGMTGAAWQAEFDFWTAPPYRYRPTRVSGSESSGQARYTAILEKSSKTTDWAAVHGADAAGFLDTHSSLHAAGYRLVWFDGFGVGSAAYYNGIWEKNGGAMQQVVLGQSLVTHHNTDSAKEAQGYHLTDLCAFGVNGAALYAGVWRLGDVPNMHFHYNETGAGYQNTFNTESYGLVRVNGVTVGGVERFTSVWRQGYGSEGWASHGMNDQWFTALNLNAQYQGYRPVFIDAYNNGNETRYNATWIVGSSRVDLQACKLEYSIVSPK